MQKTTAQQLLEARNPGKSIREVIEGVMKSREGQRFMVAQAAIDMGISNGTLYQWCRDLGITIEEYRRPKEERIEEDRPDEKHRARAGNSA